MDFVALKMKIEAAVREAFADMVRLHKDEGIYAFALYSDEGAMTVCPSTNTRAHLAQQGTEEPYFKFTPAEWKYEMQGADDAFTAISTIAREHVFALEEREDDDAFLAFRQGLQAACVDVLEKLKQEDFFCKTLGHDVFLTFAVSDGPLDKKQIRNIVSRLNSESWRDEYLAWMKSWKR